MEDSDKQTKKIQDLKLLILAIFACAIIITGIYFTSFHIPKTYEKDARDYVLNVDILNDWILTNENVSSLPAYDGIVSSWQRYFIRDNNNLSITIIVCEDRSTVQELMNMDKITLEYLGDINSNDIGSDGFTCYWTSEAIPEFDWNYIIFRIDNLYVTVMGDVDSDFQLENLMVIANTQIDYIKEIS